jgi:CRISPR-associated endonuclease/helicase Cas3
VVTEAKSVDELLQRIGRAGRILGKKIKNRISKVLVLMDESSYKILEKELEEGKGYQRSKFANLLVELNAPPQKREFVRYIKSYALLEAFYPLYKLYCIMPDEDKKYIEELFEFLQDIFEGNKGFKTLLGITSGFEHQKRVSEEDANLRMRDYQDFCEWIYNQRPTKKQIKKEDLLKSREFCRNTTEFIKQQYASKKSLFSFRDSFGGPQAVIYDPKSIFVNNRVAKYDLLHIIRNYNYVLYDNKVEFKKETGNDLKGDFYLKLLDFRKEKLKISYRIKAPYHFDQAAFEDKICNRPTALKGLEIIGSEALKPEIKNYFKEEYISMMIVSEDLNPSLYNNLSDSSIYPINIEVIFSRSKSYKAILGSAGFLVYPEMRGAIYATEKQREELPIII